MQISKARAQELGLLLCKEKCITCSNCYINKIGAPCCKVANETISFMFVAGESCPLVSEDAIREKMTAEELEAYYCDELEILTK